MIEDMPAYVISEVEILDESRGPALPGAGSGFHSSSRRPIRGSRGSA